jgi:hypothetical protein
MTKFTLRYREVMSRSTTKNSQLRASFLQNRNTVDKGSYFTARIRGPQGAEINKASTICSLRAPSDTLLKHLFWCLLCEPLLGLACSCSLCSRVALDAGLNEIVEFIVVCLFWDQHASLYPPMPAKLKHITLLMDGDIELVITNTCPPRSIAFLTH